VLGPWVATPCMPIRDDDIEAEAGTPAVMSVSRTSLRGLLLGVGVLLLLYLCWRIVVPFLPALCWAFALALIGDPIYKWLIRQRLPRNLAALSIILLTAIVVIGPAAALAGALASEASQVVNQVTGEAGPKNLREAIENNRILGPIFRWLDSRYDLLTEARQLARSAAGWASSTVSSVLTGSIWLLTQIATTMFVLFYFLRDGETILNKLRSVIPLSSTETDLLFTRIAQIIRVSLGGKLVVAGIQGTLGGLMFGWLGLPAPIFWGCAMAVLSVFPVIGSFVVWAPVAITFALQGDWRHAAMLTAWGVLIINPVDNLLGPVLVGSTLRMHTLLTFFSVIGGLAAFGVSGVVLGPVTAAVVVGLADLFDGSRSMVPVREVATQPSRP
jgi:predicted PurR-regulated permease PerM